MAYPTLTPSSQTKAIKLPVTGTLATAAATGSYPFGAYVKTLCYV